MDNLNHGLREFKIPSVDWVAFAVGIVGLIGSRFESPLLGLLGLAVFGPPLLRELGVLKDCDEYTQNISRRAGFHAVLVVAILLFINHLVFHTVGLLPTGGPLGDDPGWAYSMGKIRYLLVVVFLMSSLWQFWGGCLGSFRILLGIFGISVIEVFAETMKIREGVDRPWGTIILILAVILAFAFASRRRPKIIGGLLLAICLIPMVKAMKIFQSSGSMEGWLYTFPMITQWGIAAAIGLNLLWSEKKTEPDQLTEGKTP